MTSTPTTPTNVKSSEPCENGGSADAPTAMIEAMAEEEEGTQDVGKTVALTKGGVTDLARTASRGSLSRKVGGIILARIAHKATQASLRYCRNQGEMRTVIRTKGLGASRNDVRSPAS